MVGRLYLALKAVTAVACAYEALAIPLDRDRVPTISKLCGRHHWLRPVIIGSLALHLFWPLRRSAQS